MTVTQNTNEIKIFYTMEIYYDSYIDNPKNAGLLATTVEFIKKAETKITNMQLHV